MKICTSRPDSLPPLDAIGLQSFDQALYSEPMTWRCSYHNQKPNASRPISDSVGLYLRNSSDFGKRSPANLFATTLGSAKPSGSNDIRGNSVNPSLQGISGYNNSSTPTRSSLGLEVVAPLQPSTNSWDRKGGDPVKREVRGLLNKLTEKTFDSVSNQIIVWADKLHDGHGYTLLIQMICDALDDRLWLTRLLARICEKMERSMHSAGSQAFREGLFQQCMAGFQRHWAFKDGIVKNDDAKAKRQALGLLSFIGQLFNLQTLKIWWQAIILCVETLLGEVEERKLEGLCALLAAAGERLKEQRCPLPESKGCIDACFARIENLRLSGNISPRMKFKLKVNQCPSPMIYLLVTQFVIRT